MNRRLQFLFVVMLCAGLGGCIPQLERMFSRDRITPIVNALKSTDAEIREKAVDDLGELADQELTEDEAFIALRAAADTFPKLKSEWQDAGSELIEAVAENPHPSYVPVIAESFSRYSPKAQAEALRLLASIRTVEAARALVKAMKECDDASEPGELQGLVAAPRYSVVFFPALLDLASRKNLQWPILKVVLAFLDANELQAPDKLEAITRMIGPIHTDLRPRAMAAQKPAGMDWRWDDEYLETRSLAGLVTDVLGHTQTSRADEYLAEALSYRDPRIKAFAVIGLLRHGKAVEAADILAIASDAENRNMFYRGLKEIKRESLFPPNYRNQASFAESDMVGWLTYPTELGRAPDEIELMAIVPGKSSDGPTNYYLFRFRTREPHWSAKDGWMAGVSGPFLTADEPTTESNGDTFSSFTPWDSKTPAEHVASVTESLDKSREIWMKGQ